MTDLVDRVEGMLFGAVLGDALGVRIEFLSKKDRNKRFKGPDGYLEFFKGLDKMPISDETILLMHSMDYFGVPFNSHEHLNRYFEHLGVLSKRGDEELKKKGFSRKMRNLFRHYKNMPGENNPFADNRGAGFVPLILPLVAEAGSAEELQGLVSRYVSVTHASADAVWVPRYFNALNDILDGGSVFDSFASRVDQEMRRDDRLAIALSGNIERLSNVTGSSFDILPTAMSLYVASGRDIKNMVRQAMRQFNEADFDTLFFTTGAMIGAAIGYSGIPDDLKAMLDSRRDVVMAVKSFTAKYRYRSPVMTRAGPAEWLKAWVSQDLESMSSDAAKAELFRLVPELAVQDGYDSAQPRHCYTLLDHTLRVVDAIPKEDVTLRTAALLHDVAKPYTRNDEGGVATYHNHSKAGARMAHEILSRMGDDAETIEEVTALVDEHVINYKKEWSDKAVRRFARRNKSRLERLFNLVDADNHAQLETKSALAELKSRIYSVGEVGVGQADAQVQEGVRYV